MEINSSINTFHKGMNLDSDVSVLDKNTIRYAQNIRLVTDKEGTSAIAQNSDYIQRYNINLPEGQTIIGVVEATHCVCSKDVCEPKDCGVIFTKDANGTNWVYTVDFESTRVTEVISGKFGWNEQLSLVSNFEACDVSIVYIADGVNSIRRLNIAKQYGNVVDPTILDIIPASENDPFEFVNFSTGNIKASKVQYTYQLFTEHGTASTIAPISPIIPISETIGSSDSEDVYGSQYDTYSNKGVILKTSFVNNNYDRLRVYRIVYEQSGQIPRVEIIDEVKIKTGVERQNFEYIDYGSNLLNIITIDELNQLAYPYDFTANSIEAKDNILFAANVTENTWDVEYDARAYRANKSGIVKLEDASKGSMTFNISNIPNVDIEHDCLNPSNISICDASQLEYNYDVNGKLGGTGLNISYSFIFKEVILSSQNSQIGTTADNLYLNSKRTSGQDILFDEDGDIVEDNGLQTSMFNYSDAWMCSNYVGYQRDEVYRFGIVLYNNKGIASPVHWIGDIRMPSSLLEVSNSNLVNAFRVGHYSNTLNKNVELLGYAMGLRFEVRNLPKDVYSYEIVRCARTSDNRTVVTQAIMSSLINDKSRINSDGTVENNWLKKKGGGGDKELRPQFLPNLSRNLTTIYQHNAGVDRTRYLSEDNYYELISPEICVDSNNTVQLIKNAVLTKQYEVYAYQGNEETLYFSDDSGSSAYIKGYALGVIPEKLYQMDGQLRNNDSGVYWTNQIKYDGQIAPTLATGGNHGYGLSNLLKYYNVFRYNGELKHYDIEDAIAPQTLSTVVTFEDTKNYQQTIGTKTYTNTSIAGFEQWGFHGKNIVIKTEDDFATEGNPYIDQLLDTNFPMNMMNCVGVYNIKKSSELVASSYANRTNSIYISCGAHAKNNDDLTFVNCFGGDTYLGVLDYLCTSFVQVKNDSNDKQSQRIHIQCYIPFETTINLNLFSNKQYHNLVESEKLGQNLVQNEPIVMTGYSQTTPPYVYNTIYSQQGTALNFISKPLYSRDDVELNNRIVHSELKHNLEMADSWAVFKVANYLDVDNKYGQITNLKKFNNKLFFFQDNAIGIAAVNDRSLITDNNIAELTLGTGKILDRYDYLSTVNGDSIINDYSIVNSNSTLYWYDYNKNVFCTLNNGVVELSKLKSIQSYLNDNYDPKDNRKRPVSLFNAKYNEIWFKLIDQPIMFNEQLSAFTSFNTHNFDYALIFGDKIVTVHNNKFYEHNEQVDTNKPVEPLISQLNFVVNDNFVYTKVFDNVLFYADFEGNVNNITDVLFKTKNQTSIKLTSKDIECREDTYRFAIPREDEKNNNMSYIGRMRGKYLEEQYTFDCNDNKTFKIPYIKTTYRQSML